MKPATEADDPPVEHVVAALRERMYGAISCLATLAALARYTDVDTNAWYRVIDVAVAAGGLWAAARCWPNSSPGSVWRARRRADTPRGECWRPRARSCKPRPHP